MLQQARQKVVADHRKIGVVGTALIWRPTGIDLFITDRSAEDQSIEAFVFERDQSALRLIRVRSFRRNRLCQASKPHQIRS